MAIIVGMTVDPRSGPLIDTVQESAVRAVHVFSVLLAAITVNISLD